MSLSDLPQRLRDRYFPDPVEEERQAKDEIRADNAMIRGFVISGYYPLFRKWLKDRRREAEPAPGVHADMLYQSGRRDGVRLVEDFLDGLESRSSREVSDD